MSGGTNLGTPPREAPYPATHNDLELWQNPRHWHPPSKFAARHPNAPPAGQITEPAGSL